MKETVVRYSVYKHRQGLPENSFRAVFLSDMHNCIWNNDIKYMLSLIDEQRPDLVLCGGDMLVAHPGYGEENIRKTGTFIKELSKKYRIYYALGNHEYRLRLYKDVYGDMYDEFMGFLKDEDVIFMDNKVCDITVNEIPVRLCGLSITRSFYQRFGKTDLPVEFIRSKIGKPKKDSLNILLAHHPKYIGSYLRWGADIVLSGHYHGGVMQVGTNKSLISPDPSVFPHNAHGRIDKNGKTVIISSGLGEHTIPFRINNPRELVVIDVIVS